MEVMIDLELLSLHNNAAIISIGAVRFDLQKKKVDIKNPFYQVVNAKSSQAAGGHVCANTVLWWFDLPSEARRTFLEDESLPIEPALKAFNNWLREKPCTGIWGNGADFDNVILRAAYDRLGWTAPWPHELNRCYKTFRELFPDIVAKSYGIRHNALCDAIGQAKHLIEIFKKL